MCMNILIIHNSCHGDRSNSFSLFDASYRLDHNNKWPGRGTLLPIDAGMQYKWPHFCLMITAVYITVPGWITCSCNFSAFQVLSWNLWLRFFPLTVVYCLEMCSICWFGASWCNEPFLCSYSCIDDFNLLASTKETQLESVPKERKNKVNQKTFPFSFICCILPSTYDTSDRLPNRHSASCSQALHALHEPSSRRAQWGR